MTFAVGEFYHVYNRGTDKRLIFQDSYDLDRFLQSMEEFNSVRPIGSLYERSFRINQPMRKVPRLVNIVSYCLNPNHFHLLLEQLVDNGISEFMRRLGGGYAYYFNIKYKRIGTLFQGRFKVKHIDSNEYLIHVSAYINLNNKAHRIQNANFKSSWDEYAGKWKKNICEKAIILDQFAKPTEYKTFAESSLKDILRRKDLAKELENLLLE